MNIMQPITPAASPWSEEQWDELLDYIKGERVIPIIGRSLSTVEVDGQKTTLDRYVATQLAEKLNVPAEDLPQSPQLNDVVSAHLRRYKRDRSRLYQLINNIVDSSPFPPPEALKQLAAISHFKLFATTAFDRMLEAAVREARHVPKADMEKASIGYAPNKVDDISADWRHRIATVYHLLGIASVAPEYVVCDEDLLEFLCAFQSGANTDRHFFRALKDNHLLFLGIHLSDWPTRLFLRGAKQNPLSEDRRFLEILADEYVAADQTFVAFLTNFSQSTRVYSASAHEFVNELHRRWTLRFPDPTAPHPAPPPMPRGAVFISYASEDRPAAKTMKDALQAEGFSVWYDKDELEGGDHYDELIRGNIKTCGLFIALLSRNTDNQTEAYFIQEWAFAKERARRVAPTKPFIVPVIIDDTNVPDFNWYPFSGINADSLRGGVPTPQFIAKIKSAYARL